MIEVTMTEVIMPIVVALVLGAALGVWLASRRYAEPMEHNKAVAKLAVERMNKAELAARPADWQSDVYFFMKKHGQVALSQPGNPGDEVCQLRTRLINEEACELTEAMAAGDPVAVADGVADLIYVTLGTAVAWGIDTKPIFNIVHCNNMLKPEGLVDDGGKVLKDQYHIDPTKAIAEVLEKQRPLFG